jgi:hypothetical protein
VRPSAGCRSREGPGSAEGMAEESLPARRATVRESASAKARDGFGLPGELMKVLPDDPFAQLDVARKITSMALASRLGRLEAEAARLRAQLAERNAEAEDLRERVEQLDAALAVATGRVRRVEEEKVYHLFFVLPVDRSSDLCGSYVRCHFVWHFLRCKFSDASSRFGLGTVDIQEALLTEKASLTNTVRKLNKDVAKVAGRSGMRF